ncbi:MAG: OmpA family protein [Bacteroidia bacterium]|nr:OmpA family protein [Bacteroidia bacterium]MDW8301636.1 OmpA family protein [Bacteroidia bacterium]
MKLFVLFLVLFVPICSGLGQSAEAKKDFHKYMKQGELAYYNDLFDEAAHYFELAAAINPNSFEANFMAGLSHERGVRPQECLKYFEQAYKLKPEGEDELIYLLGRGMHLNNRFDEAIKYYKQALNNKKVHNAYNARIKDKERYIGPERIQLLIKQCENGKKLVLNPLDVEIKNLGPNINGKFPDYVPALTADERRIFFTTRREGEKDPYTGHYYEEIFYADKDPKTGEWKPAKNIGKTINAGHKNESAVSVSLDGSTLYIYDERDLYYCTLKGNEWSKPEPLKEINTKHWETHCAISADGTELFFTSDRPGGYGGLDIYVAKKQPDGKWGQIQNLGPNINTEFDEEAPFIHYDGVTLYFSSRGHNSMGGYDIFYATRNPDGSWNKPVNIGYPINTASDDVYFVINFDRKRAYYSSARGDDSYGDKDIYMIIMPEPKDLVTVENKPEEKQPEKKPEPIITVTRVYGTVTDERTGQPLEADVTIVDNETGNIVFKSKTNSATGYYVVTLPSGKNYGFRVEKPGYTFYSENFDLPMGTESRDYEKNAKIKGFSEGTRIIMRNIFYDYNKATLRPQSKAELDRVAAMLNECPKMRVQINAHTDSDGTEEYNLDLSQRRAQSVVDYLVKVKGIDPKRLSAKGFGESQPVDTNETDEGKQNNRRTELEIIGGTEDCVFSTK